MTDSDAMAGKPPPRQEIAVHTDTQRAPELTTGGLPIEPRRVFQVTWAILGAAAAAILTFGWAGDWRSVLVLAVTTIFLLLALWLSRQNRAEQAATLML